MTVSKNTKAITMAAIFAAIVIAVPASGKAGEAAEDSNAIAALIRKTWETPEKKIDVAPVVTSGDYAVAGWVQGSRGGRALLRKSNKGWTVILCSGDAIRSADALAAAGVPHKTAQDIADSLAKREAELPADHVAKFSLFEGTVPIGDMAGGNPHHHHHHTHH